MSGERGAPWVAYFTEGTVRERGLGLRGPGSGIVACVVTPLLPDDPKPGETWVDDDEEVTIVTAPFDFDGRSAVIVSHPERGSLLLYLGALRRPPVLKTYRLRGAVGPITPEPDWAGVVVRAESREAALAKLSEALEEVES